MNAIYLYRVARWMWLHRIPILPKLIYYLIFLLYNCSLPYTAKIGKGTRLGYGGMGVVIHARAVIGSNCLIAQQVTIGGRSRIAEVPVIGDNVYIGAGAKVLGNVKVGSGSVIGANAVVVHDVPPRCVAAGIPARIIKENIDISKYV